MHPESRCRKRPPAFLRCGSCQSASWPKLDQFLSYLTNICALISVVSANVEISCFFMWVLANNIIFSILLVSLFTHLACFSNVVYGRPRRTLAGRVSAVQRPPWEAKCGPGGVPSAPKRSPKTPHERGLQKRARIRHGGTLCPDDPRALGPNI